MPSPLALTNIMFNKTVCYGIFLLSGGAHFLTIFVGFQGVWRAIASRNWQLFVNIKSFNVSGNT
jgi:hypothetical protein